MTDIEKLNLITDEDLRRQAKFDHVVAVLQGESGNFGAGILISAIASLAVTMVSHGFDPVHVILNIGKAAREEVRRLLNEQGIRPKKLDG